MPLKVGPGPKGEDRIPNIHFSGAFAVSFREGIDILFDSPTFGCGENLLAVS